MCIYLSFSIIIISNKKHWVYFFLTQKFTSAHAGHMTGEVRLIRLKVTNEYSGEPMPFLKIELEKPTRYLK